MTTVLILFYLYRMADQRLYKLVKWCKSLPLFKNIMVRQWDKLNSSPRSPNVCVYLDFRHWNLLVYKSQLPGLRGLFFKCLCLD